MRKHEQWYKAHAAYGLCYRVQRIGYFYIGMTHKLDRRLESHRTGRGSSLFVKLHGGLLRLVESRPASDRKAAKRLQSEVTREYLLKHKREHVAGAKYGHPSKETLRNHSKVKSPT